MKTPSDRLRRINERINELTLTALIVESRLTKAGEWDENKHPRADDGKFGSGNGSSTIHEPERKKTEFSPVSHTMAKEILSRTNKQRTKDINTLAKQPKNKLKERAATIQDQIDDARAERKKDPDNPKWKDIMDALSLMYGDVTAAMG